MKLLALPAFADNYLWLLHDGHSALVVDPGDATPVLAALAQETLKLAGILVTHHHADHVGGVAELVAATGAPVWGPARERLPVPAIAVREGDRIAVLGLTLSVLDVPGHTAGHVAYFFADPLVLDGDPAAAPLLFCGDTLFSGGCGRLFEGSAEQMADSLQRLSALPGNTRVCCTHEYTLANLRFARKIEADNVDLAAYELQCTRLRQQGLPTLPSSIALERQINPFLRCEQTAVIASVQAHQACKRDRVSVFAALRQWKNKDR